ncbi:MAG TPA: response regulator transcription factor [Candidatus Omnitrophota bacterium]|nr:response regulator transcription factor [Candidatus Omnitrophota bacterium]HPN55742.1 response regulator transcription factor [Candidatus Omnitrophota bacterium]
MNVLILIVEDEKDIVKMLEYNLQKEGYRTVAVSNGEEVVRAAVQGQPDLILLDLMLPGMDGFAVCQELRKHGQTAAVPIIMLTAKSQEADKIVGLELGADDYVTKPFSPRELSARIKAVLRRSQRQRQTPEILRIGDLAIDFSRIRVTFKDKVVDLTAKEFELLKTLIQARGRVLSRDYLLDTVWGLDHATEIQTRTVDVHVTTLRKKIRAAAGHIITVKNYGYRFDSEG